MKDSTDALIDAATDQAALYEGDDRPNIKTDVMNAFYAGVYWALSPEGAQDAIDANRLAILRRLCGDVEDGSSTAIHIFQDDATKDWIIRQGPHSTPTAGATRHWFGKSLRAAIDAVMVDQGKEPQ